jgi:carbamoyltransferase
MNKKLLSINIDHDSSISYLNGDKLYYAKLERINKTKHAAIKNKEDLYDLIYLICNRNIPIFDEICIINDVVIEYDITKTFLNYDKINYPISMIGMLIDEIVTFLKNQFNCPVVILDHHEAHSLSQELIFGKENNRVTLDGLGNDFINCTVYRDGNLTYKGFCNNSKSLQFDSLGLFVELVLGYHCGVDEKTIATDIAGKFMALQSYGNINENFLNLLIENDLSIENFNLIETLFTDIKDKIPPLDLGRTFHHYVEKIMLPKFFSTYFDKNDTIVYSGGVAQNIVWNTELKRQFPNLIIGPHVYDGGLSLGGIEFLKRKHGIESIDIGDFPYISMSENPTSNPTDETIRTTARLLADNKVVGWHQGLSEIGPRALGNRSILLNPLTINGKNIINKIKNREQYRPFGASVLLEHTQKYFDIDWESPYMLYTANVKDSRLKSITHIDGTCRIQTVDQNCGPYRKLLEYFYELTGCPILLNTSLNVAGEPIAAYTNQALSILNETDLEYMVIGNEVHEFKLKLMY